MNGKRVMRFVGNRQEPEEYLYEPFDELLCTGQFTKQAGLSDTWMAEWRKDQVRSLSSALQARTKQVKA